MAEEAISVEATVREVRRETRKKYAAEEKLRIVLERLRGESRIAESCRRLERYDRSPIGDPPARADNNQETLEITRRWSRPLRQRDYEGPRRR